MSGNSASYGEPAPIGVIIPTFNRMDVLPQCLRYLEKQTWQNFEVVLIDDGSTDGTAAFLEGYTRHSPLRLRYVKQQNTGPAGARNHAISLLQAPVCLMIGDDILAAPDLVAQHLAFHHSHPEQTAFALGFTRWSEQGQAVTPFMRWLEGVHLQFDYTRLRQGTPATWEHFYTSNLSGKTALLQANPFNRCFTRNVMEDIELGYRLHQQGKLHISFLPDAIGDHVHPTNVRHACRRMVSAGVASSEFQRVWPDLRPQRPAQTLKRRLRNAVLRSGWALRLLQHATSALTRLWCPNPLLMRTLLLHHEAGYTSAANRKG